MGEQRKSRGTAKFSAIKKMQKISRLQAADTDQDFGVFLNFWQYCVQSLSVHSEHFRAALDFSQKRSG